MARQIDPSNLDEDDKQYLRDRPNLVEAYEAQGIDIDLGTPPTVEAPESGGASSEAYGDLQRQFGNLAAENEALRVENDGLKARLQQLGELDEQQGDEDEEEDEDDYNDLTIPQLKAEIEARNAELGDDESKLSLEGNKKDLVKTLEDDDAARGAGDEDEDSAS